MGGVRKSNQVLSRIDTRCKSVAIRFIGDNNVIKFGKDCNLSGVSMLLVGNNNTIIFGDNVTVNASKRQPTIINAIGGRKIIIGDEALLSNNIEIHTSDYHGIYDYITGGRLNYDEDVIIGNKTWIGLRTIILKGSIIPDGCVVGAGSIICKKHNTSEGNVLITGVPGNVARKQIVWDRKRTENIYSK